VLVHIAFADRHDGDRRPLDLGGLADAGNHHFTGLDGGQGELDIEMGDDGKVHVLVKGGIADIAHLYEVDPFGGEGDREFTVDVGGCAGLQVGDINRRAGDRFAVGFIGNGTGQGAETGARICQQGVIAKDAYQGK
jgi:hypothetical protein